MSSDDRNKNNSNEPHFLRLPEVKKKVAKSRSSIYRDIQLGKFPSQYELGSSRSVGWLSTDIEDWIKSRQRINLRPRCEVAGADHE